MLLRLRQCCAHTLLVPALNGKSSIAGMDLSDLAEMGDSGGDLASQECASCGMTPEEVAILTTCQHVYCDDCFKYEVEVNNGSFPCTLCGEKLTLKSIAEKRAASVPGEETAAKEDEDADDEEEQDVDEKGETKETKKRRKYKRFVVPEGRIEPSTKMRVLISDVLSWRKTGDVGGAPNKAVVFSQWTSVLDILARCLEQEEILYERLDGSMSRATREAAMDNFRVDEQIPVFLMSLKAGNLGVNMTTA